MADHVIILTNQPRAIFDRFAIIKKEEDSISKKPQEQSSVCDNSFKRLDRSIAFEGVQEALIQASLVNSSDSLSTSRTPV